MLLLPYHWLALGALTVVVPLVAAHADKASLPLLLDATVDELTAGLQRGSFSSLDLVNVSYLRVEMGRG